MHIITIRGKYGEEKEKTKDNKQIIASLPNAVKLKIKNNIKKKKTEVKKLKEI